MTFFDRKADEGGRSFWMEQLANGMGRDEIVNGFIDSTEWCNLCARYGIRSGAKNAKSEIPSQNAMEFATRLYTMCLGRDPEEDGLRFWAMKLTNLEMSGKEVAEQFFLSEEFKNLNTDNAEFLTRAYRTFMGRDPDQGGFDFWMEKLAEGYSRQEILTGFAQSDEFKNICTKYGIINN